MENSIVNYAERTQNIFNTLVAEGYDEESAATAAHLDATTQLTPAHSEKYRLLPVEMARSALFRVTDPSAARAYFPGVKLAVMAPHGNGTITYTGQELRQDDRQVFMEALYLEQQTPGVAVLKTNQFLKDQLGWSTGTLARQKLIDCLSRLQATALLIEVHRFPEAFSVSLVSHFKINKVEGTIHVFFHERVRRLFDKEAYARVVRDCEQRLPKKAYLARWLLCFYTTHAKPIDLSLVRLQELCGDTKPVMKEFTRKMKEALQQLVNSGFLLTFEVKGGKVHVER